MEQARDVNIPSHEECMRRLRAVSEAAIAVTSDLTLDKVLQKIVDSARELVHARYAALGVVNEDLKSLAEFVVSGLTEEEIRAIGPRPRGLGLLGLLLREPRPVRIKDIAKDPRSVGFPPHHQAMTSFLGVPIISRGRILGNFYMGDKIEMTEFSQEDEDILTLFAAHAAVAIDNARLYSETSSTLRRKVKELGEQTSRLETILDTMAEAVNVADPTGNLVLANRAYMNLAGASGKEELTCSVDQCASLLNSRHEDGRPMSSDDLPMNRSLRGETFTNAVVLMSSIGEAEDRYVSVSGSPIRNETGQIIGAVNVGRDVTELKEVDRLKDEFISIASHEMKSPVAAAKGFAQLLVRKLHAIGDHAGEVELAGRLTHQIDRMAQLLDQLLDISRIQSGRLALDREAIDLHLLVHDVAERVQVANESHLVQVKSFGPTTVNADRNRIEQVLTNLLTNAIKYSPAGGQVDVAVEIKGREAQVSVRDRGIGIPHDKQPYVFERFFRAVEGGGGLGLGLYISRGIVEAHGGRIWLQSQEKKGSTFYFTLPLST